MRIERLLALEPRLLLATFTVTNANDSGAGSLRQAILDANALSGTDVINFGIPGGGVQAIRPATALPVISGPVLIDGYSQPASAPNTSATASNASITVQIQPVGAADFAGLYFSSSGNTIRGLSIGGFGSTGDYGGIRLQGSNNLVVGNFVGIAADGVSPLGGTSGLYIDGKNNTVGGTLPSDRNVISGSTSWGINVYNANGVAILGNLIGTAAGGTTAVPNGNGINLYIPRDVTIGGLTASARNVISGNTDRGIAVRALSNLQIRGNYIGPDVTGAAAFAGAQRVAGVEFVNGGGGATGMVVGGTVAGAGNVISGNAGSGLSTGASGSSGILIAGNTIGLNATGAAALPNSAGGVVLLTDNNTIGGVNGALTRNVISGNAAYGVYLSQTTGNVVAGNFIGTSIDGMSDMGNAGSGVRVSLGAGNVVGGAAAGAGNVISGNGDAANLFSYGVEVRSSSSNLIAGNLIGLGADGASIVPNERSGVALVSAASNTVGGSVSTARNVISGNKESGVYVQFQSAQSNLIAGNYIGTNAAGTAALGGNPTAAITLDGSPNNTVGGSTAAMRNVIAGNSGRGVLITNQFPASNTATGNRILGNYIGTNAAGDAAIANNGDGIQISGQYTHGNLVGGPNAGQGNLIAASGPFASAVALLGTGSSATAVVGNTIGLNAAGTAAIGAQGGGVLMQSASNTIGGTSAGARNYIAGQSIHNVRLSGSGATNNLIAGNYVGTNAAGSATVGGAAIGIDVTSGSGNTIGSTVAGLGNLISGNGSYGVRLASGSSATRVLGNTIGLNAAGTAALSNGGNFSSGLYVTGPDNTIGGTTAGARNIISGNGYTNVWFDNAAAQRNLVLGNYIGTDAAGTAGFGVTNTGFWVSGGSNNTIGSTVAGFGNLISGNALYFGLEFSYASTFANLAINNTIGMNAAGTAAVFNGRDAVSIDSGSYSNTIGGTGANMGNRVVGIAGWSSVAISGNGGTGNLVLGNTIGLNGAGTAVLSSGNGVYVGSDHNTVGGTTAGARNVIAGAVGHNGVWLNSSLSFANVVQGNYIGTTPDGSAKANGGLGVYLLDARDNTIGGSSVVGAGNVISGGRQGVLVQNQAATGNLIAGNRIGTTADGLSPLGNTYEAVYFSNAGPGNTLGGDAAAGLGNVLSGNGANNGSAGVAIVGGGTGAGTGVLVVGNLIGTDATGLVAMGNGREGVYVGGPDATIGGSASGLRNVISGNLLVGIQVGNFHGYAPARALIQGNYVGTDRTGLAALPNYGWGGIYLSTGASGATIGGTTAAAGNLISGNSGAGIQLVGATAANNLIIGNTVGLDANGRSLGPAAAAWYKAEGNANDPINGLTGALGAGVTYAPGKVGQAFAFNGGAGGVTMGGSSSGPLDITGSNLTIEAYVYQTDATQANNPWGVQSIVSKWYDTAVNGYLLQTVNGVLTVSLVTSNGRVDLAAPSALALGAWVHVAATYNGGTLRLFQDGAQVASMSVSGAITHSSTVPTLGNDSGGNSGWKGRIDEATVYARALDVLEIQSIVADGAAGKPNRLGNLDNGILVNAAPGNTIGGIAAVPGQAPGNVISANYGAGIATLGPQAGMNLGLAILGNMIGTDATGTRPEPNRYRGVALFDGSHNVTIGGSVLGAGNLISGNQYEGILTGTFYTSTVPAYALIQGNTIGLNRAGTAALKNTGSGIAPNGPSNTIGGPAAGARNVISGNGYNGIDIWGSAGGSNLIVGNYIGTDATGTLDLGNAATGVSFGTSNNTLGGLTTSPGTAPGNVISGNDNYGVYVGGGATNNRILGNLIGLTRDGKKALGNNYEGVTLDSAGAGNTVGGTSASARNVISANLGGWGGVTMRYTTAGTLVAGNYIGTDITGSTAVGTDGATLGNNLYGVSIDFGSSNNTIGGPTADFRNVISGNRGYGVYLTNSATGGNLIAANYIGTNAAGSGAVANTDAGIFLNDRTFGNTVGGTTSGARNVVSGNATVGIVLYASVTGTAILGNFVGTVASGGAALTNGGVSGFEAVRINNAFANTVGGTVAGAGNVLVSNSVSFGLSLYNSTTGTLAVGNTFGLAADGTTALGGGSGFLLDGVGTTGNTIGGTVAAARNIVGGMVNSGLVIRNSTSGNLIAGNYLGVLADGVTARPNLYGVRMSGGAKNNTIGGTTAGARNLISGNSTGVSITGAGTSSNILAGNFIGTNAAGTAAVPNLLNGVVIDGGASGNTVGGLTATPGTGAGNVISGNAQRGVYINGGTTKNNLVAGNLVGLNAAGDSAVANLYQGIELNNAGPGMTIGGTASGARNVVSGNGGGFGGIYVFSTSGVLIQGNFVGTDATGTWTTDLLGSPLGNAFDGILIQGGAGNTIGGGSASARNVISGNLGLAGVEIAGSGAANNVVQGNYIGTDKDGVAGLGNGSYANAIHDVDMDVYGGVVVRNGAHDNLFGTDGDGVDDDAEGNLISGNSGLGIALVDEGSTRNVIAGNRIGGDAGGTQVLWNGGYGVAIVGAGGNYVGVNPLGGVNYEAGANLISGNLYAGVVIDGYGADGNVVAGNRIVANGEEGVLLRNAARGNRVGYDPASPFPAELQRNLISGNAGAGVKIASTITGGNLIAGNWIGLDDSGTGALGNGGDGVRIEDGASGNTIGGADAGSGNVISGNAGMGLDLEGAGTTGNLVVGNLVGTDPTGALALGNAGTGVIIATGASGNTIGGTAPGERNVISGNVQSGVTIHDLGTADNLVLGNYIGVASDGLNTLGNGGSGIVQYGGTSGNTIGGTVDGARNVISANRDYGIALTDFGTSGSLIVGNYVGTDATGTQALGNGADGVLLTASGNTIGGSSAGAGNLISGNWRFGVWVVGTDATNNLIVGNTIGLNGPGDAVLGNGLDGVIFQDAPGNTIGGADAGSGNVISGNGRFGLWLVGSNAANNLVLGNRIGTDADGLIALGNAGDGLVLQDAPGNTIGGTAPGAGNLLSGNASAGVWVVGIQATGNLLQGNRIGTDTTGTAALGNGTHGLVLQDAPGNTIGGTAPGAGNLLSGNAYHGVWVVGSQATGNLLLGNRIGTDASGTAALGNGTHGVLLEGTLGNTIGGSTAGAGNLISGNSSNGVAILGESTTGVVVEGNLIGTNAAGTDALGNGEAGVWVGLFTHDHAIRGNVISGNGYAGVVVTNVSYNIAIQGNRIGTDATGQFKVGHQGIGVVIADARDNLVGGLRAGDGNLISGNESYGIFVNSYTGYEGFHTYGNLIQGNRVGTNAGGTSAIGNGEAGIRIYGGVANTIGGTALGAGNLVSGNGGGGVIVGQQGRSEDNVVAGNVIGLDASGTSVLGNGSVGVEVSESLRTVVDANLISGNAGPGVWVHEPSTSGTVIRGNRIGTDRDGARALPNQSAGIWVLAAADTTIGGTASGQGNLISGQADGYGVQLEGDLRTVFLGNKIGTDSTGQSAIPNSIGIWSGHGSNSPTIGGTAAGARNLISGNLAAGVRFEGANVAGNDARVRGNYIGTNVSGSAPLPNGVGVEILASSGVRVGGTSNGARNVISGNTGAGVRVVSTPDLILGNYIGTDASGTTAVGNAVGILLEGVTGGATIGGASFPARNVISGNRGDGILLDGNLGDSFRTAILGNYIGTNQDGTRAVANLGNGVTILYAGNVHPSTLNTIGGTAAGARNLISGNAGDGIAIRGAVASGAGDSVLANLIGTDIFGTGALGNAGSGVRIGNAVVAVGGTAAGSGNTIAYNGALGASQGATAGVRVEAGSSATIVGNSFRNNAGLGIDTGFAGATPPTLAIGAYASDGKASTSVALTAAGLAPGQTYWVDFYGVTDADASGYGEGFGYLGRAALVPDFYGLADFSPTIPVALTGHRVITATLTDPGGATSEFARNYGGNQAPVARLGSSFSTLEGTPVTFSGAASTDPDGDPLSYAWDFGDGRTGVGASPTHTYTMPGSFRVTLTVSDGLGGTASSSLTVQVGNVAPSLAPTAWAPPATPLAGGATYGRAVAVIGDVLAVADPAANAVQLIDAATGAVLRTLADPTGSATSGFGSVLAAVSSGLAVGAPDAGGGNGAAYLYDVNPLSPGFGQRLATLASPARAGDANVRFGASLVGVGTRVAVGAPGLVTSAVGAASEARPGGAFVYDANPGSASFGRLVLSVANPAAGHGDAFGAALAALGTDLVVGAPLADAGGVDSGAAWVISGATGLPIGGALVDPDFSPGQVHNFGKTLAVLAGAIAVGAPEAANNSAPGAGAVYLFGPVSRGRLLTIRNPEPGLGGFGSALAATASALLVGSPRGGLGIAGSGVAYEYDGDALSPTFGGLLRAVQAPAPAAGDGFGSALAYSQAGAVIGAPGSSGAAGRAFAFRASAELGLSASTVAEGDEGYRSVILAGEVSDPGTGQSHTVTIDWKDGPDDTSNVQSVTLAAGVTRFAVPHRYDRDFRSARVVTVSVADSLGATSHTAEVAVTVVNVAPTVAEIVVGQQPLSEGDGVILSGRFTDPGTTDAHTVTVDWGDGSPAYSFRLDPGVKGFGGSAGLTHVYRNNPSASPYQFPLKVTVSDEAASGSLTRPVTVLNAAPVVRGLYLDRATASEGDTVTLSGQVDDAGVDDAHTVTIDWGDGSAPTVLSLEPGSRLNPSAPASTPFSASHVFANNRPGEAASTFSIRVTSATDADGASAAPVPAQAVTVFNVLPTVKVQALPDDNTNPNRFVLSAGVVEPGPVDRANLTYSWVLTRPDGKQATGSGATFTFDRLGSDGRSANSIFPIYNIALTVRDDIGIGRVRAVLIAGTNSPDLIDLSDSSQFGPITSTDQAFLDQILVLAYGGDDTILGGSAKVPVLIDGGEGTDVISGGDGDDTLTTGHGDDVVRGGQGNNVFEVSIGSSPTLINDGTNAASINTIDLSRTAWAVSLDLRINDPSAPPQVVDTRGDTLKLVGMFQNLVGTSFGDTLYGNDDNNLIRGGGGDDLLFGGGGNDTVVSGSGPGGRATLSGGGGADVIFGGAGDDTLGAGVFSGPQMTYTPMMGNATLVGGSGSQVIFGGGGNDSIRAGSGSTTVAGGGGADVIFGGTGSSTLGAGVFTGGVYSPRPGPATIYGGSGGDVIYGGSDGNTLVSGSSSNTGGRGTTIQGGAGPDVIFGGGGRDSIHGGDGNNTIAGGAQTEVIFGGSGDDSIVGSSRPGTGTTISGGGGRDIIYAGSGDDTLAAGVFGPGGVFIPGSGPSTLVGGAGADVLYGGRDGSTLVSGSRPGSTTGNTLIGGAGPDVIFGGGGRDSIHGGDGNNTILGGSGPAVIYGGRDNDSIVGGSQVGGGNTIVGGGGRDVIYGGRGNDTLISGTLSGGVFQPGAGGATLVAGSGNTTILGGSGPDVLYGGAGDDSIVSNSGRGSGATVIGGGGRDIIFGGSGDDTIDAGLGDDSIVGGSGAQYLFGGPGNDTITSGSRPGTGSRSTLAGSSGNDVIFGGAGEDSIDGGSGNDSLYAGSGTALLDGGAGNDLVAGGVFGPGGNFVPGSGRVTLAGGGGNDLLFGGTGPTTMGAGSFPSGGVYRPGTGSSTLIGGSSTEIIYGGLGNDFLVGGTGPGLLDGNAGNDTVYAGGPNATLRGGSGNDTLRGGSIGDVLFGDDGDDTVIESGDLDFLLTSDSLIGTDARGRTVVSDTLHDIQRAVLVGGDGANRLDARYFYGPVSLFGGAGDDTLLGASVAGATGPNTLEGGAGNDSLVAGAVDTTFVFSGGSLGSDVIAHGEVLGRNRADFSGLDGGVKLDMGFVGPQVVSPAGLTLTLPDDRTIQDAVGSRYDDFLIGTALPNLLIGGAGNDELVGRGGENTLIGGDTQAVFLDFDSLAGQGLRDYSQAERDQIQARLTVIYAAFAYTFTQARPQSGAYSTITFNDPGLYGLEAGKADSIDWRNLDRNDNAAVNVHGLLGREGQPAATGANVVAMTITVAAHELGHIAGLKHADSFGPIGSGIYAGVDPSAYVDQVDESDPANPVILAYPGPTAASETPLHVMASGASVHTSLFDALGQTFFGAREAIKLAYSQQGTPTAEAPGAHNAAAAAQPIGLAPLSVPNTIEVGADAGASLNVTAAAVIGRIGIDPLTGRAESDFYRFHAAAGTILNVDVFSSSLSRSRIPNPIDSIIRVYRVDSQGVATPVPYYASAHPGRVAVNDNGFQGQDSSLVDLVLPATGEYLVEVDTYNPPGGPDQDTGDYELFLYTFARGGGATGGDSLFGGSAKDTIIGDTTGGTISSRPKQDVVLPGSGETTYVENVAPQFVKSGADRTVAQNTLVILNGSFFDPDDEDVNTFLWQAKDATGAVVATGTDQGFAFLPTRPGAYTVTFAVSDGVNTSASSTLVTVENVRPIVSPPQTPKVSVGEGTVASVPLGSFSDPGAGDGPWHVVVAWGDGQTDAFDLATPGPLGTRSHVYANNRDAGADYLVTVTVTDKWGAEPGPDGVKSFPVAVANRAPVVSAGADASLLVPSTLSRTVLFADVAGDGPWTATVDYGDGSGVRDLTAAIDQAARSVALDHTYTQAGTFTVTVKVRDKDGAEGVSTLVVRAATPLAVAAVGPVAPITASAVSIVTIEFTTPISAGSFTAADLTLTRNGQSVALTGASISPVPGQPTKYAVNLGTLASGDGRYVLGVDASGVADPYGNAGSGAASASWIQDATRPTSKVDPLPSRQTAPNFPVIVTGSDGAVGSGVAAYDLFVSIDGGPFALWTTVPASAPSAVYPGQSNRTYGFRSVARDAAGNAESKPVATEAMTYVPDLTAPETAVSAVDASTATFSVSWGGTDAGGSGLASIEVFAQVDGGAPQSLGVFPAGGPTSTAYQAIADGSAHAYRFFSVGRDNAGNVEAAPAAPADVAVSRTFALPAATAITSFKVQNDATQRSYIRTLDLLFNRGDTLASIVASVNDGNPNNDRAVLQWTNYSGATATRSLANAITAKGFNLGIDFGPNGVTGSPSSTAGDGIYTLLLDLDNNGSLETSRTFHRLLGDLNGDRAVDNQDVALIDAALASGVFASEADVNGDGLLNTYDKTLLGRSKNRKL